MCVCVCVCVGGGGGVLLGALFSVSLDVVFLLLLLPHRAGPAMMLNFTASLACVLNVGAVNLTCVADGLPRPDTGIGNGIEFLKGMGNLFTCGAGSSCNNYLQWCYKILSGTVH